MYPEKSIPTTKRGICDTIAVTILCSSSRKYTTSEITGQPYYDFDGIFFTIQEGIENIRVLVGNHRAEQLQDMLTQAKAHHEEGWQLTRGAPPPKERPNWWKSPNAATDMRGWWERRIGNALLQDMQAVLMGRQPWAYPKDLYRWHKSPWFPELSEADLLNKDEIE